MIDKDAFLAGLAILAGAFGREIDAPVQRAYYAVLNPQITTEEFERAVNLTLTSETYWPSPAVLLGKVKADDSAQGFLALEHVNRVMNSHGGFRFLPHETFLAEFDAPTKAAITAVGGLSAIANTTEDRWPGMQKKFAAAFVASQRPQLPAAPTDPRVKALVSSTAHALMSGRDLATGEHREGAA